MLSLKRTDSGDPDFRLLVNTLDRYLMGVNGASHAFFDQFNQIDEIREVLVVYSNDVPVGCGAIRGFDARTVEVKRMFVDPAYRRSGVARALLRELEEWSRELGYRTAILETGHIMYDAIALYTSAGYERVPNYGHYAGVEMSVCFRKQL